MEKDERAYKETRVEGWGTSVDFFMTKNRKAGSHDDPAFLANTFQRLSLYHRTQINRL